MSHCHAWTSLACRMAAPCRIFRLLTSVAEGRGFNAYYPMPFRKRLRIQLTDASAVAFPCFYQIDYTLSTCPLTPATCTQPSAARIRPTLQKDFIIAGGFKSPWSISRLRCWHPGASQMT